MTNLLCNPNSNYSIRLVAHSSQNVINVIALEVSVEIYPASRWLLIADWWVVLTCLLINLYTSDTHDTIISCPSKGCASTDMTGSHLQPIQFALCWWLSGRDRRHGSQAKSNWLWAFTLWGQTTYSADRWPVTSPFFITRLAHDALF